MYKWIKKLKQCTQIKWHILPYLEGNLYFSCHRQLLFCRVTLGKSFLQFSAMKMAHSPPGHHSVTGRPSVNGLALAEYVIYRGEQAYPEYLITYQIVRPEGMVDG